jgi:hypothetical protein
LLVKERCICIPLFQVPDPGTESSKSSFQ